jgi:hypothetical protein
MDRDRETLRNEILQLDEESQRWLKSEIEDHLAEGENTKLWLDEAERRDKEWEEGRIQGIDAAEAIQKARDLLKK